MSSDKRLAFSSGCNVFENETAFITKQVLISSQIKRVVIANYPQEFRAGACDCASSAGRLAAVSHLLNNMEATGLPVNASYFLRKSFNVGIKPGFQHEMGSILVSAAIIMKSDANN